ncbi:hypothetical protein IscW_ISCW021464, partial [Ixodes scapularis]
IDRETLIISGCHSIDFFKFYFSFFFLLPCCFLPMRGGVENSNILNAFFTRGYDKRVRPNYG